MSPFVFFSRIRAALITAFSTSSCSATLPTAMAVANEQLGVPQRIAGFVLPLGSTMCMNGTAIFEGITVIFLAEIFGVDLSIGQMAAVMVMSVLTAVGAAGVPGGSIPLLVGVLTMFGVPGEGIAIVLGVDRILDMSRTTVNVCGDLSATTWVAKSERHVVAGPGAGAGAAGVGEVVEARRCQASRRDASASTVGLNDRAHAAGERAHLADVRLGWTATVGIGSWIVSSTSPGHVISRSFRITCRLPAIEIGTIGRPACTAG